MVVCKAPLMTMDGRPLPMDGWFRGRSAFLVCGGPSLTSLPLQQLHQPGIVTMAINNAATIVRPTMWVTGDEPANFCDLIWRDAGIVKFVRDCHIDKPIYVRDKDMQLVPSRLKPRDMPCTIMFRVNSTFRAESFLSEPTCSWGCEANIQDDAGETGGRSTFLIALKLLYVLGIRRVYLLGCDFRMKLGAANYAFAQDRGKSSVNGNNASYATLNRRLGRLRPLFEAVNYRIYNCTPDSGLHVFDYMPFSAAIRNATGDIPKTVRTEGMYDHGEWKTTKK